MSGDAPGEPSLTSRVGTWFAGVSLCTKSVLVVCGGTYIWSLLVGFDALYMVCFRPEISLLLVQAYRLITSAIFHVGLLHVGFNMLAFVPIGRTLERHMGTLKFAHLIGLIIILGEAIYLLLAYTLTLSMVYPAIMLECPIGFSGVVFGLIVIDTKLSGASQRSILGLFTVPAALYPWALLVFWQLMIPRISFFGHLCGILVGEMYVRDWLQWVVLSTATVERMEDYSWLSCCTHRSSYVSLTTAGPQQLPTQSPGGSGWSVPSMSWLRGNRQQQPALADPGSVFAGPARTVGGERRDGDVPPWAHVEAELTRVEAGASAHALGTVEPSASYPELPTHIAERQPLVEEPQPSGSDGDQGAAPFDDSARQQLLEMGFKPQAIQAALRAADGDVERAVEILTGQ